MLSLVVLCCSYLSTSTTMQGLIKGSCLVFVKGVSTQEQERQCKLQFIFLEDKVFETSVHFCQTPCVYVYAVC
jgi:hypothetical protein